MRVLFLSSVLFLAQQSLVYAAKDVMGADSDAFCVNQTLVQEVKIKIAEAKQNLDKNQEKVAEQKQAVAIAHTEIKELRRKLGWRSTWIASLFARNDYKTYRQVKDALNDNEAKLDELLKKAEKKEVDIDEVIVDYLRTNQEAFKKLSDKKRELEALICQADVCDRAIKSAQQFTGLAIAAEGVDLYFFGALVGAPSTIAYTLSKVRQVRARNAIQKLIRISRMKDQALVSRMEKMQGNGKFRTLKEAEFYDGIWDLMGFDVNVSGVGIDFFSGWSLVNSAIDMTRLIQIRKEVHALREEYKTKLTDAETRVEKMLCGVKSACDLDNSYRPSLD